MQALLNFFRPEYLFNLRPEPLYGGNLNALLFIMGAVIVGGFVWGYLAKFRVLNPHAKQGYRSLGTRFLVMGAVGFVYIFFAYEGAAFLSARFWVALWLVVFLLFLIAPVKNIMLVAPRKKEAGERRREFEKYIPR